MAVVYDHSCLVSTLKNTSGQTKFFGFIPPHGKRLAADQEINVFGDIKEAVNRGDRFGNRNMLALLNALDQGYIEIIRTPLTIAFDETNAHSRSISIDGGNLHLAEPCWNVAA